MAAPTEEEVRHALAVLAAFTELGQQAAPPQQRAACPTVADSAPRVEAASTPGCARTYGTYWRQLVTALGTRRLDEIHASDLAAVARARQGERHRQAQPRLRHRRRAELRGRHALVLRPRGG